MTQTKTAISIRKDLYEETNAIANEMSIPRSQLIALALEEFVLRYRNRNLREKINEAYATTPMPDEKASLEIIRSHQKKLAKDEEW